MRADAGDRGGLRDPAGHVRDLVEGGAVERGDRLVRVDVLPEHDGLARGVAGDRVGVLERQHAPSGGIGAGALELVLARPVGAQLVDDLAHPRERLDALAGLEARRQLQDRHVGEGVVGRVDGVGEAALLADLVEQPRAHRAAEQRRVDAQRGARRRVARIDRRAGRRCAGATGWNRAARPASAARTAAPARCRRPARSTGSGRTPRPGRCRRAGADRLPTRNAPPREPAHWRERKATIASRVNVRRCSSGPEHGPAERMVAERRAVDQVLGHHRRLVVRAGDLLDHHPALAVELLGVDLRPADEVGQQVDRVARHLGAAGDVEGHEVVRRVGVEHGAHALRGLVDLAVVVVLLAALEHQVLEEVGHPVLLRALGAGAGVERHQHGGRPRALDLDPVDREAGGEGGRFDASHRLYLTKLSLRVWPRRSR